MNGDVPDPPYLYGEIGTQAHGSTRDARDRLMKGVEYGSKKKEKKKGEALEKPISIWTPSFQPEDFMEDANQSINPPINSAGPSKRGGENKEEEEEEGRKRTSFCDAKDDEQDDEKMEKFFAFIRSFRDARDCLRNELNEVMKSKIRKVDKEKSIWVPSFQWEDFREVIQFRSPPVIFHSPCNEEGEKKDLEKEEVSLDLKLTL
ncbi:hypothetical protein HHK36_012186 [Tetracentron sinense]|uniref:Uncharacterized protein n=1 Tax=Tetracentron sinense TaxID=13715 RepID=A0A835DIF6_TETSI|nr:hypothetical protein HHK36_012186 [Tetracentron sinense]